MNKKEKFTLFAGVLGILVDVLTLTTHASSMKYTTLNSNVEISLRNLIIILTFFLLVYGWLVISWIIVSRYYVSYFNNISRIGKKMKKPDSIFKISLKVVS